MSRDKWLLVVGLSAFGLLGMLGLSGCAVISQAPELRACREEQAKAMQALRVCDDTMLHAAAALKACLPPAKPEKVDLGTY